MSQEGTATQSLKTKRSADRAIRCLRRDGALAWPFCSASRVPRSGSDPRRQPSEPTSDVSDGGSPDGLGGLGRARGSMAWALETPKNKASRCASQGEGFVFSQSGGVTLYPLLSPRYNTLFYGNLS